MSDLQTSPLVAQVNTVIEAARAVLEKADELLAHEAAFKEAIGKQEHLEWCEVLTDLQLALDRYDEQRGAT